MFMVSTFSSESLLAVNQDCGHASLFFSVDFSSHLIIFIGMQLADQRPLIVRLG